MPVETEVSPHLPVTIEGPASVNEEIRDERERLAIGARVHDLSVVGRLSRAGDQRGQRAADREPPPGAEDRHGAPASERYTWPAADGPAGSLWHVAQEPAVFTKVFISIVDPLAVTEMASGYCGVYSWGVM